VRTRGRDRTYRANPGRGRGAARPVVPGCGGRRPDRRAERGCTGGKVLDAKALERRTVSPIATAASRTGRRIGVARTDTPCAVVIRRIHLYRRGTRRGASSAIKGPLRSPMTTPASSTARRVLSSPVATTGIWTGEGVRSIRRHSIETPKILSASARACPPPGAGPAGEEKTRPDDGVAVRGRVLPLGMPNRPTAALARSAPAPTRRPRAAPPPPCPAPGPGSGGGDATHRAGARGATRAAERRGSSVRRRR
jgi:hypothetical protein